MKDKMRSLHLEVVIGSLLVKVVKTLGSLYFRGSWPNKIPPNVEARRSPYGSVLCDDDHELSSLPDQATKGQSRLKTQQTP